MAKTATPGKPKNAAADATFEYPEDIRLLGFGEQLVTDTKEKYSIMDVLVMASHGMLMRVEKCDDGKLLCAKIQANKITKKEYPGDFNKEIKALELIKKKRADTRYLPSFLGKGQTPDITFYITDHVGQTLQRQLKKLKKISPTSGFRICRQMIDAIKVVHDLGLVHGNIRPSSILVAGPHERDIVRLFGFQFCSEHPPASNDRDQIGYPLDKFTARGLHKGERAAPKHDFEMYLYLMYDLTIGLPWDKATSLKEVISSKDNFWKKFFQQNWGRIPAIIRDNAFDVDKDKSKIEYVVAGNVLDDLIQMLPPRDCYEWEINHMPTGQPQRKGPTVITPLDIALTKGQSRTVVERCEAVLQPDL
ncbi:hypothetical protein Q1695_012013 [Nippostrongylus brasiliensis]|nr:hypothetical protein Q1695_012013 [Nippostrongylus brasiliensis]